jgi:threonine aldolase
MKLLDLRSDTLTRPTRPMLQAMMDAQVGDDVFGEDPSVRHLEERAADMFGKQEALFCASGTMANQIAIQLHTRPGNEVVCEANSHVYLYEGGGIGKNAGCSVRLVTGRQGLMDALGVKMAIRPDDPHFPSTSLVCLEHTSNKGGGICYPLDTMRQIRGVAQAAGLAMHLDGARVFNAMTATGQDAKEVGELFDTMTFCLSKGLGCPVGSLLLGSGEAMHRARRIRKAMGGGMRQAGYLAAAGTYALDHHMERLAHDHENAKVLAEKLLGYPGVAGVWPPETNIVVLELGKGVDEPVFLERLKDAGLWGLRFGPGLVRLVCHLDVSAQDIRAWRA